MFNNFTFLNFSLIILGNFFYKNTLIVLLLFLEILVLTYVFLILEKGNSILFIFNDSIIFMVFRVIAATLGLTLLRLNFKTEGKEKMTRSLV